MPLAAFEDFVYGACLRDWDAESRGCTDCSRGSTRRTRFASSATRPICACRWPVERAWSTTGA